MSLDRKLDQVIGRFQEIESLMSTGTLPSEEFSKLSKEYSDLTPLVALIRDCKKIKAEMKDLDAIMSDPAADREMKSMAETEFYKLKEHLPVIEKQIQAALL